GDEGDEAARVGAVRVERPELASLGLRHHYSVIKVDISTADRYVRHRDAGGLPVRGRPTGPQGRRAHPVRRRTVLLAITRPVAPTCGQHTGRADCPRTQHHTPPAHSPTRAHADPPI